MVKIADVLNSSPKEALDTWKMLCGTMKMALPYWITFQWLCLCNTGERMSTVHCQVISLHSGSSHRRLRRTFHVLPPFGFHLYLLGPLWWQQVDMWPLMSGLHFHPCLLLWLCSTAWSWANHSSPWAVLVHLPEWKVFCCKGLLAM